MITKELDQAIRQLSKILKVGYVDYVDYKEETSIVTSESRDFDEYFQLYVNKQTISFPSSSLLIPATVKTLVEVKELITDPTDVANYDECILTILRETGQME